MNKCNNCPRKCNIDRDSSVGFCGQSNDLKVALHQLHFYEEPCISGTKGSGTIFFSGCNLKCLYCQNYKISQLNKGKIITVEKLVNIMKKLEKMGAHNINLVTPSHFTDKIIEALKIYRPSIPIIYNTSGYDNVDTIKKLKNYIDIYLTDFKYYDSNLSSYLSKAKDYKDVATKAIKQMRKNCPSDEFDENGMMKKGLIIRHLVLPDQTVDSINILQHIKRLFPNTMVSLMSQYTPCYKIVGDKIFDRKLKKLEYTRVVMYAKKLDFNGYIQDLKSADLKYTPKF